MTSSKENDRPDAATSGRSVENDTVNAISEGDPSFSDIISEFSPSVKDLLQLKEFRERSVAMAKDLTAILSEDYPKFTKQAFSMCENPEQYGVVLHPIGFEKLQAMYPDAAITKKKHKSGKHTLKKRISARLTDGEYEALIMRMRADGFDTVQAFLVFMVRNYLKEN